MPKERVEQGIHDALVRDGGALLPYFTAGYPDPATTAELIRRADQLGAATIEIGFPFSDSIADGPVIQNSFYHVLKQGHQLEDIFAMVASIRSKVSCGLVAMVSSSIVRRAGVDSFMARAGSAGFDGVILPDVPVEESGPMLRAVETSGLCYIGLIAPTTKPDRCQAIARASTGFVYRIAVAGTTGERDQLPPDLPAEIQRLRGVSKVPICVGFGISTAEQVRRVCGMADGAIVGSGIIRRIDSAIQRGLGGDQIVEEIGRFLSELMPRAGG